jgi:8-amino-7-oxononanoate synthase
MNIVEKCRQFYGDAQFAEKLGYPANPRTLQALGLYPFFIPIQQSEGPEIIINRKKYIMIGSNNYLGMTSHPKVKEAASRAIKKYGTGCTGSRLLNGTLELHLELEEKLAAFVGKEKALIFSTGFQTNLGTITSIVSNNDLIVADKKVHASIIDALFLAKSQKHIQMRFFKHNDVDDLSKIISQYPEKTNKLVVVDGVYSMEGDIARLNDIIPICKKYKALLMVDDAHGIGVLGGGKGTASHFQCTADIDLIMGTFSKSFASIGGFIAGSKEMIHWIQHFARSFIFSASLPPANIATVLAVLDILQKEPELVERVLKISETVRSELRAMGFDVRKSQTPIVPVIIGDQFKTVQAWNMLFHEGIYANVALPPAVPSHSSLLRTSYMATHNEEQISRVLQAFKKLKSKLKESRFQKKDRVIFDE